MDKATEKNANTQCFFFFLTLSERNVIILQNLKNPLVHLSLLGKTWSGQVDYPSLSNCSTSTKWQEDELEF